MKEYARSTNNRNILQIFWNYVFVLLSCILNFVYSGKRRVFCQESRVFCYTFVHSGTNIVHPATKYTKFSKSCIPECADVCSENVMYSSKSSCILGKRLSPLARFTCFHFVYSGKKIVYTEYAKILKQNTLFSEALGA